MKQTNYQLFDFLDFDPSGTPEEILWKACSPLSIFTEGVDAVIEIPFQGQKKSHDITSDQAFPRKNYFLKLRCYGERIIRLSVGFGVPVMQDTSMLLIDKDLPLIPNVYEINDEEWIVKDRNGTLRAKLNRKAYDTEHWSDLIPSPDETLELVLYPDGKTEVRLSAFDQFFPDLPQQVVHLHRLAEHGGRIQSRLSRHRRIVVAG